MNRCRGRHGVREQDQKALAIRRDVGITYPEKTGQGGSVGPIVTKTLVIVGDPQLTAPPGRPRGAMLRAYDKQTGCRIRSGERRIKEGRTEMRYRVSIRVSLFGEEVV